MKLKALVVSFLESACTWQDRHLPDRLAGWRGCWLADLSGRLEQRWQTNVWKRPYELHAHAEAMADALEDLITAEHTDDMWERAREVWQAYVNWADNPPRA